MRLFKSQKPHFEYLRKKWSAKHRASTQKLFDKHLGKIALGSLGGLMLLPVAKSNLAPTHLLAAATNDIEQLSKLTSGTDVNKLLAMDLKGKIPQEVRALDQNEEREIADILTAKFGFKVLPQIDDKRLNRSFGLIGGEQHLYRYPGDNLYAHARDTQDWAMYTDAGIAPNLGAWGYFAPSRNEFSKKDEDRERYYLAVQTFLSPGFAERVAEYRDFYRYRKMLVVNPKTGQAVVADIADAGPSPYTGKHLGGSPEVMEALGLASGPRKGAVIYMFVDDPADQIPLGPIKIQEGGNLPRLPLSAEPSQSGRII